jgi:hypothetical protein
VPLADVNKAHDLMRCGEAMKVALVP